MILPADLLSGIAHLIGHCDCLFLCANLASYLRLDYHVFGSSPQPYRMASLEAILASNRRIAADPPLPCRLASSLSPSEARAAWVTRL